MSTPASSAPRPSLHTSNSNPSSDSLLPSHLQSRPFIFKLLLYISSLVILCISLIFAVVHWDHLKSHVVWKPHPCTTNSPILESNPSNSSQYRVTAQVSGLSASSQPLIAYYGPTIQFALSRQQAEHALDIIQTNSTCYVSNQSPPHVSLQSQPNTRSNSSYIAWTATFIAAVTGVIQLNFFAQLFHKFMTAHLPEPSPHIRHPPHVKPSFLTSQQTSYICHTYLQDLTIPQYKDWACSICLDDHSEHSPHKGVKLPCQHTYHQRCIQEWLRKGKSVCPLCNWNVKSIFKKASIESTRDSQELASLEDTNTDLQPTNTP